MSRYAKHLLIAESPSKARTLSKILGRDYVVKASFGHVSDLPKSRLGFDPDDNFKAEFNVTKDKSKIVRELKSYINKDTIVYLATDDDSEGHAISHHLYDILKLKNNVVKRVIFHEVTKDAIMHAISNPVPMNTNSALQAIGRRVLDRAVGYKLSPLLWKKIKFGISAGRTQSVALRIICDLEKVITDFKPDEFWKLKLNILSNPKFKAELSKIDNKKAVVSNETEANAIKNDCDKNDYKLEDVIEKDTTRNPPPPFTTSTLQQVASSKAGFGVKQTMSVAQKLYDGSISIPGHTGGLITYMRTDSVAISSSAITMINNTIDKEYGSEYKNSFVRVYKTKSKGAQEAHECIRPTNLSLKPSDIKPYIENREWRLYYLIWSRTMATQMSQAKVANTTYKISAGTDKKYEYTAKGTKILFPGYLKVYGVGEDTTEGVNDDEKFLPTVDKGTTFKDVELTTEQNFTKPPSRYSEASLVKKLETEGIGRPSTYATTISTIITREYVERTKDKKLIPTKIGMVVSDYLVDNFPDIVNVKFTSIMEEKLDKVGTGETTWQDVMKDFYVPFVDNIKSKEGGDRVQYSEAIEIGIDKATSLPITIRSGSFGNFVQIGERGVKTVNGKEVKVKPHQTSPIPKGIRLEDVTLEQALHYLKVPRVLGDSKDGKPIKVGIGRFGGYANTDGKYYGIKKDVGYDVYDITLEQALDLIKTIDDANALKLWKHIPKSKYGEISVINGQYGAYIRVSGVSGGYKKANYKLPKGMVESEIKKLTLDKIDEIIKNQDKSTIKRKKK